jgi:hypothetical protein
MEEVTRKLAGSVSADPAARPRMSFGLNFFLHDGALLKLLSSSWQIKGESKLHLKVKDRCTFEAGCASEHLLDP